MLIVGRHNHGSQSGRGLGIEAAELTGNLAIFDSAIAELKGAEDRIGDPDISRLASRFERRASRIFSEDAEPSGIALVDG
jgi:hypothetical protein